MDENPYQSPLTQGTKLRRISGLHLFLIGAFTLAPVSWLLGRGLIPPDDQALAFSLAAWPVLTIVWGGLVAMRRHMFPGRFE
jgi:hypothetical protein